jgi:hypothetical protein
MNISLKKKESTLNLWEIVYKTFVYMILLDNNGNTKDHKPVPSK